MVAAMGLAFTDGQRAGQQQFHPENMKQKKAATPMPLAISGMKIFTKKRGKE
jgi:hypothetical protein